MFQWLAVKKWARPQRWSWLGFLHAGITVLVGMGAIIPSLLHAADRPPDLAPQAGVTILSPADGEVAVADPCTVSPCHAHFPFQVEVLGEPMDTVELMLDPDIGNGYDIPICIPADPIEGTPGCPDPPHVFAKDIMLREGSWTIVAQVKRSSGVETSPPIHLTVSAPPAQLITFEEPIPVPSNLGSQYCNNPDTNKGVEFASLIVVQPTVATASGTHSAKEIPAGDDVDPFGGGTQIVFTTGQSHVSVKVGLDRSYDLPITAYLKAYDDPDVDQGTKLTPDPDPSVLLGTGPTPITQALSFSMPNDEAIIRRIEIVFLRSNGGGALEEIDDLAFSRLGPTCVTDSQAPTVDILQPVSSQSLASPQVLFHYRAQDVGSGIARIRVAIFDAMGNLLVSGFPCGGPAFPRTCPGDLISESKYYTYFPRETRMIVVEATDYAGHTGQDQVLINMVLPETTYNLWALGVELVQNIQQDVPTSTESRSKLAPQATLDTGTIPMIANKRTVLRLYPGLEGSSVPVEGVRASLSCYTFLSADLANSTPCDGPLGAHAADLEIAVDPANGNNPDTLRRNPALTWNFILPDEWTVPGGPRFLVAHIQAPIGLPECGSVSSGCRDGANFFILRVEHFLETAPLIVKPRFACVRRNSSDPKETCDAVATTVDDGMDVAQWFLFGKDWDSDGILDPFFSQMLPLADGGAGVQVRTPVLNDYVDGDMSAGGNMNRKQMNNYLEKVCDAFVFDFWELFTDPGELVATAYPPSFRYLAFVPPPISPGNPPGIAYLDHPCAVAKVDLGANQIGDGVNAPENDWCSACASDPKSTIHWDEKTLVHETTHTMGVKHASCDHNEDTGGPCDPAPSVFPCPHGGICLSAANPDEPFGFNTYALSVLPPNNGAQHAHDYMSYGGLPNWISAHTYKRLFNKFRSWLNPAPPFAETVSSPRSDQPALFVSGQLAQDGTSGEINNVYKLPQLMEVKEGSGSYSLELEDDQGQTLAVRRFEPVSATAVEANESLHFFEILAFDPNATRMVLKANGQEIAERLRSPGAPSVQVTKPESGEHWDQAPQSVHWQAVDADGPELVYTVQYSPDDGVSWITLAVNLSDNSLQVNPKLLPGSGTGRARIRVFASDGFNSAFDSSETFTVQGKPPAVRIQAPQAEANFAQGELIELIASAIDAEDGTLQDSAFTWRSNLDGFLGHGHSVLVRDLSPGRHSIGLAVVDSSTMASMKFMTITVLERPNRQPLADADHNQTVLPGTQVKLDGRASFDPDGDPLQFSWRLISAPDGAVEFDTLKDADTPTPWFIATLPGAHVLELVVRDGQVNSDPAQVVISVAENICYLPLMMK